MNRIVILLCACIYVGVTACKESTNNNTPEETASANVISDTLNWSERMALSIMKRHPEAWQAENKNQPEWDYKIGLLMTAFEKLYEQTNDSAYLEYIIAYAETMIDSSGHITDYDLESYNIDLINPGKFLFDLYERTNDQRYLIALQTLRKQLDSHPRTNSGGFWHKKIYPYQMWLDGIYMGTPFYARYTATFENGAKLEDIIHQYEQIQEHLLDEETGLLYHGWDESRQMDWANDETGRSPGFWSRSLGWYTMALVDVLDYIPKDYPERKQLVEYLNELAAALVKVQDESGLWYQVPDKPDGEGNYLEASSSAMFAYAFAKGARKGYLPVEYETIAQKTFEGILDHLIEVEPNGEVHITNVCGSAGLGGDPYRDGTYEYYISETIKTDNLHGLGPFILAAVELEQ